MSVTRYDLEFQDDSDGDAPAKLTPSPYGDWVSCEDYRELLREKEALESVLQKVKDLLP